MGSAKPAARTITADKVRAVQSYATSLLYLNQEAERDGLPEIAAIMATALSHLGGQMNAMSLRTEVVLDSSLCDALMFLHGFLALPPVLRKEVTRQIVRYERQVEKPSPRRVSRKLAVL